MSNSGKAFDLHILGRILRFAEPYKKILAASVVLTIALALLTPIRPLITQFTLDKLVATGDEPGLIRMTLLMLGVLIFQSFLQYLHTWNTNLLGQNVVRDLRYTLFEKMMHFRIPYFDRTPVGTGVTRSVSDMETIADIFSEGVIVIIGDLLQLIVIIAVMFAVDWRLALISLSTVPLLIIATNIFKNRIKTTFTEVRNQVAALNTFVQEHLTGMRIVQVFGREDEEYKRFVEINDKHRKANNRSVWYYSIFFPVVEILSAISIGLIVWWGAGGIITQDVTFGNLVAFIMYINMLFRPIRELADKFNTLQMGMVSSERILTLLDQEEQVVVGGQFNPGQIRGEIEFRNVWFHYGSSTENEAPNWVLKGISFHIRPGETIAIVGPTGAGKTSIVGLLNRFYEIQKGEILLDGVDIRNYDLAGLRRHIGMVMQDVFLFSDTIANNISLKNPDIPFEKMKTSAQSIGADGFIDKLPGNYDFVVQERGHLLSTGQRQLLSFVRAHVYDTPVLVLDEATSSVDPETEEMITKATRQVTQRRTSIVIAHRLATIQGADRILVLQEGTIVESGSHQELLNREGLYKHLVEIQFRKGNRA